MSVPNGSHEHAGEPNGLGVLVTGDHRRRARQYGAIDASDFDSVECTLRVHWGRRANRRMALLTAALAQRRLGYLGRPHPGAAFHVDRRDPPQCSSDAVPGPWRGAPGRHRPQDNVCCTPFGPRGRRGRGTPGCRSRPFEF
jgi:hypothetical protein